MKKLIMCCGLPGSGKSTWAQEQRSVVWVPSQAPHAVVVVNKDQLREALGQPWSKEKETVVLQMRDARVLQSFQDHQNVIVISDDTNLDRKHKVRLRELAAISGAEFEVKRFDTPLEECVKRAAARTTQPQVPERAIRDMAKRYGWDVPTEYPAAVPVPRQDTNGTDLMPCIICDLDGTLSLLNGRDPYQPKTCDADLCNPVVRTLLELYYRSLRYQIIYLSGREDTHRPQTQTFFRRHHCPPGPLYMRRTGDHRKDWVVKGELFDAHVRGRYDVKFVLDDRNQVVNYWRHLGLICLQVAEGAF